MEHFIPAFFTHRISSRANSMHATEAMAARVCPQILLWGAEIMQRPAAKDVLTWTHAKALLGAISRAKH
jgi:hypothetical protein